MSEDKIATHLKGMDEGADFCIRELARRLGVNDWEQGDGTEDWEGDVSTTIYNILVAGNIIDDENGTIARLSKDTKK